MPNVYYRSTYMLPTVTHGVYHDWIIQVYTFWHPIEEIWLRDALIPYVIERNQVQDRRREEGYEAEEVFSHEAKGVGFYFAEIYEDNNLVGEPRRWTKQGNLGRGRRAFMAFIRSLKKVFKL